MLESLSERCPLVVGSIVFVAVDIIIISDNTTSSRPSIGMCASSGKSILSFFASANVTGEAKGGRPRSTSSGTEKRDAVAPPTIAVGAGQENAHRVTLYAMVEPSH
jgi:hypothetical protein